LHNNLDELERTLHSLSRILKILTDKGDMTILVDDAQFSALKTCVYLGKTYNRCGAQDPVGHYLISLWTTGGEVKIKRRGVNV
jgi:hypothetical protein